MGVEGGDGVSWQGLVEHGAWMGLILGHVIVRSRDDNGGG